ncbi:tripartite tricarboxylate transporter TctB family protein [Salinadaptatus halalkaliphilus]|nr:tripartite tricarboxylate transporter TctB family protein [Salinadaptatus halalkaliphilus]
MLVASGYMIWETFNFGISSAATFPRLTAGFVLIGTLLLVFRSYLPDPLYSFVAESADLINVDDDELVGDEEPADDADDGDEDDSISTVGRPIHDSLFTSIIAVGYGILGYAIGILWASPIFVFVYGLWFKLSWKVILVLVVVSILIGLGFYEALGLRIDRGNIFFTEGIL